MNRILLIGCFLLGIATYAQIKVGLENNSQWYIDDSVIKLSPIEAENRIRTNSYLKLDYDYDKWSFGAQMESYLPKAIMNYSPDLKKINIGTLYAKYNNYEKGINVTAGHFYDQLGSGLLFRSWEDRQLGINNAVLGLNAKYNIYSWAKITVLGGKQRTGMGFDLSKSFLIGSDFELNVGDLLDFEVTDLNVGFSYLGRKLDKNEDNEGLKNFNSGYSARIDFNHSNFYFGTEYIFKDKDYAVNNSFIRKKYIQNGKALLFNGGYSQKGLSVDLNLRRIENISMYSERELYGNDFHKGILNYVPALTKQYDYSLQNIYVYQAQSNLDFLTKKSGEIGGQFDVYYEFEKGSLLGGLYGTNLVLNGSYWAGLKTEIDFENNKIKSDFLAFGDKYYSDLGIEVRKKWSKNWSSIFMYLNQYYNSAALESKFGEVNSNIASAETTFQFLDNKSVRLEAQHLWANADKKNWAAATLEFAYNSNWSIFVNDMYNYGNDDSEKRIHYYNVGGSFTKGNTRIAASYGRQRGGLLCVGGVCRIVSEASGLTLGISTSF